MTAPATRQPDTGHGARLSLQRLLLGIIDYAGLFPPARLDMKTTVGNYAAYLDGDLSWMLGRLIVPAARLDEFERQARGLLPSGDGAEPWPLSGLVAEAGDPKLKGDLERIAAFNEAHAEPGAGLATLRVVELRAASSEAIDETLAQLPDDLYAFFELPAGGDSRGLIAALAGSEAGAKVRTGGVATPSPEDLARFIAACASARVPFKATAGLHHPLRHRSEAAGIWEFGFLNVFVAALLAAHKNVTEKDLVAVLTDESLDSFSFEEDRLRYRDHELSVEQVERARFDNAVSFGACSFEEPCAHLQAMGLVEP